MSTPTAPVEQKNGSKKDPVVWCLWFRQGNNPHPKTLHFLLATDDQRDAYQRAKRHCEVMNYRFVHVEPFLVDLDLKENFLNQEV